MASQGPKGLERIIKATQYSWQGLKATYAYEEAFRQEILLAIVMVPLGVYLGNTGMEKAILVSVILLILIAELLNTGIEAVTDRVGTEHHELSGRAKDIGSAAVAAAFLNAAVVWGLILIPLS